MMNASNCAMSLGARTGYAGFGGAYIFLSTSSGSVSAILGSGSISTGRLRRR